MKPLALFLFRLATGAYLVAWAAVKFTSTERAIEISKTFYFGYFNEPAVQHGLGALAAVLGIFVALGFLRAFAYPAQALVLAIATAAVARTVIAVPVDLANGIEAATLLLPTLSVFLLSLTPLVWWKDDFLSLDRFIAWRLDGLSQEAAAAATLSAPAAAVAAHVGPTVDEPAPVEAEPVEAEPVEPAPVEAEAVEAEFVEAEPVEATLVEAEPVEAEPVEAVSVEDGHGEEIHVEAAHEHDEIHAGPHEHDDHAEEVHPAAHDKHDAHPASAAVH